MKIELDYLKSDASNYINNLLAEYYDACIGDMDQLYLNLRYEAISWGIEVPEFSLTRPVAEQAHALFLAVASAMVDSRAKERE